MAARDHQAVAKRLVGLEALLKLAGGIQRQI